MSGMEIETLQINFMTYTKRVWFSNGIHHHYSMDKFIPEFSEYYFTELMNDVGASLNDEALKAMFLLMQKKLRSK